MTRDRDEMAPTQSQASQVWAQIESQPIENIVWGRLYAKNIKLKSLGMRKRIKFLLMNSSFKFDLCYEKFSAGRGELNTLCLTLNELPEKILSKISKVHFEIKRDLSDLSNPVYIQDLSRNGTFINSEKIGLNRKRILHNNDVISLSHPQYKAFQFKDLSPNEAQGLPNEIVSQYYVSRQLGNGACGIVKLVYNRRTCMEYAMKHVQKNRLTQSSIQKTLQTPERIMNEARIMKSLEHPCVIKMHDIIDKPESVFMILELMKGGDLLSRIIKNRRLSENTSKLYFYQMCHAVKYLHDEGITHRDLKPDNVLLEAQDEETLVKVSDFGLSKFVSKDSVMQTLCGTPLYVAPEIILTGGRGSYTKKVDIWSLGVVLFTCLSGTLPFSDDYGTPASEQIKKGKFKFSHPCWRNVSRGAKQLIEQMLTVDPNHRPSINTVLKSPWLQDTDIIQKCSVLMKKNSPVSSDDENFLEPPFKRARR